MGKKGGRIEEGRRAKEKRNKMLLKGNTKARNTVKNFNLNNLPIA